MSTPFGPRLIGETEKTLNAVLRQVLDGTDLDESEWVTLRLSEVLDGTVDGAGLVAEVRDRAHFDRAAEIVDELSGRGLLHGGALTAAGRALVDDVTASIATRTSPIWADLPPADVEAATRVLHQVVRRARAVLA